MGVGRLCAELDSLLASGLLSRHDHAERWAEYQRDIIDAERKLRRAGEDSHAHVALPAVLAARKAAILDAARRGLITDRTAARHVAAIDEHLLRAAMPHGSEE